MRSVAKIGSTSGSLWCLLWPQAEKCGSILPQESLGKAIMSSNAKKKPWLFRVYKGIIRDYTTYSYVWIIVNHYKDPY